MEKCRDIEALKKEYEPLRKKYNLPEFMALAEDFDIERVLEKETEFLLREIRRGINEKISAYFHLLESFANPSSASVLIFSLLKNLKETDKKIIKDIYKKLSKIQIKTMKLDTIYSEKNEAEFIFSIYNEWQGLKEKIYFLFDSLDKEIEENIENGTRGYFG